MCEDGKRREVRRRVQTGANAWRAVEGGNGTPADLKKTEGQGHEHLCHTGMSVRNGNLGTDRTTTTKAVSVTERLVRSRLQWAGHVERMAYDRLPKRVA